jgi:hypothetical protein
MNRFFINKRSVFIFFLLLLSACSGGNEDAAPVSGPREIPLEPSTAFQARQSEYLDYCSENSGPGRAGSTDRSAGFTRMPGR